MKSKAWVIISFSLLVIWMAVIFLYSAQDATVSTNESGKVVDKVAEIVVDGYKEMDIPQKKQIIRSLQLSVRTAAHFCEYTILGVLGFTAFSSLGMKKRKASLFSFVLGVFYCITDEIHQIFVPGRTAEWIDIFIDSAGVLTGIIMTLVILLIYMKITTLFKNRKTAP